MEYTAEIFKKSLDNIRASNVETTEDLIKYAKTAKVLQLKKVEPKKEEKKDV